jgi:hypothetical protein
VRDVLKRCLALCARERNLEPAGEQPYWRPEIYFLGNSTTFKLIGNNFIGPPVTNASLGNSAAIWAINAQSGTVYLCLRVKECGVF